MTKTPLQKDCSKCERNLPADIYHFHRDSKGEFGLCYRCRECRGYEFLPEPSFGHRVCTVCGQEKPATWEHFPARDGKLRKDCKECALERSRERSASGRECRDCGDEFYMPVTAPMWKRIRCFWCRCNICSMCGRRFRPPNRSQRPNPKYCSRYCLRLSNRTARECCGCGDTFWVVQSSTRVYCEQCHWRECISCGKGFRSKAAGQVADRSCQSCTSCAIDDCTGRIHVAGLCVTHSKRKYRYGDVRGKLLEIECERCGESWSEYAKGGGRKKYCDPCRDAVRAEWNREQQSRRRALKQEVETERIDTEKVFKRDGWKCQIGVCWCDTREIDKDAEHPHSKAGVIDHIVPLSRGGDHTMRNVQAAHFICNNKKGDRSAGSQLRLVG